MVDPKITKNQSSDSSDREIVISRTFDAPRNLVFKAWTDPGQISLWWGPKGFKTSTSEMKFKVGGAWRYVMHSPDGTNYPNQIVYEKIVAPELISYVHGDGTNTKEDFHVTVTFEAKGNQTLLTMHSLFPSAERRAFVVKNYHAIEGGNQTLGRLAKHLQEVMQETPEIEPFVIKRSFDAPIDLLFEVWTKTEHMQNWFGPKGATINYAKQDFRLGGIYHYCMTSAEGLEMWGKFVYKEIDPPRKIVFLNSFSDKDGGITRHPMSATWPREMLSTVTFTKEGNKTLLCIEWYPHNASTEEIETFEKARSGMTQGWNGTFEQLEEYLKKVL